MPEWKGQIRSRLATLRLSPERESEIIEEMSQHLDQRYEELRSDGVGERDALHLALNELLEGEALAKRMRSLRQAKVSPPITLGAPGGFLGVGLLQDLRYALRMLRKQPGFAVAAVLTLALGIGANSAIFALVDAILLRPLPFPQSERLVTIWERTQASSRNRVAPLNLVDWNERNRTFEVIGGFVPNVGGMVMGDKNGSAETVARQWVTAQVFDALGVKPILGRTFLPADDTQEANVVVLNEAFWRSRFNADPRIIGRDLRLDGESWTVVGVVPQEAQLIGRSSIWAMVPIPRREPAARSQYVLQVIGRLKTGVTLEAATADIAAISDSLAQEFPKSNAGRGVALEPMRDTVIGSELRQTSLMFLGVVGFVLLICCANVANLLLARATLRKRELAIRSALGADRRRVIRQLLTESLILAILGGLVGLMFGAAILKIAPLVIPQELLPAAVSLNFDLRVVGFCGATALVVGLLFGLVPSLQASDFSTAQVIASDSRTATSRGGRIRGLLVVGQVATSVVLLYGAGLLLRTLLKIENVDRGYQAESVLSMVVDPPGETRVPWLPFYTATEKEIMALPGVRGVAWATTLPFGSSYEGQSFFEVLDAPPVAESQRPTADYQIVSPAYFPTLDLPVTAGRAFDDRDGAGSVPVCIVNEALVRRYFQGRSPLGLRVAIRRDADAPPVIREVVGVARQVKARANETEDLIQIYVPLAQDTPGDIFLLVRPSSGSAEALASSVRAAIARIDKQQLVSVRNVMTLEDVASTATARHRFRAILVMAFAGLALLLAMIGLFGVLAYSVQQRLRDFGVRRALGASTSDILRLIGGSASRMIVTGVAIGLVLSAVLGRQLSTMLFGVEPLDPLTFACVVIVLAVSAVVSISGPAMHATRVDPALALRGE